VNVYRRVEGSSFGVKQAPLLGLHDPEDEGTTILLSGLHVPEDLNLHQCCFESLKSHKDI